MKPPQIFETVLYASDLDAAAQFYGGVLGLEVISRGEYMVVFRCGNAVLLVFNPEIARHEDRGVPAHGTDGAGHIAFAMPDDELDAWRARFREHGIAIEMEKIWENSGGRSLYVRDPAGNSVEMAPPTLWGGGWKF